MGDVLSEGRFHGPGANTRRDETTCSYVEGSGLRTARQNLRIVNQARSGTIDDRARQRDRFVVQMLPVSSPRFSAILSRATEISILPPEPTFPTERRLP